MKNNDLDLISDFFKATIHLFTGLFTVLKQAFKKRVTLLYPEIKPEIPDKYRGFIVLNPEKCVGCGVCAKLCPALEVLKFNDKTKKLITIDLSRCISCGNCAANCPKGAINITKQYELATASKKDLLLEYTENQSKTPEDTAQNQA